MCYRPVGSVHLGVLILDACLSGVIVGIHADANSLIALALDGDLSRVSSRFSSEIVVLQVDVEVGDTLADQLPI